MFCSVLSVERPQVGEVGEWLSVMLLEFMSHLTMSLTRPARLEFDPLVSQNVIIIIINHFSHCAMKQSVPRDMLPLRTNIEDF